MGFLRQIFLKGERVTNPDMAANFGAGIKIDLVYVDCVPILHLTMQRYTEGCFPKQIALLK